MADASHAWLCERVQKHDKDLYEGNGKPSITVRLDRAERFIRNATALLSAIFLLLVGAIFTTVGDMIIRGHK